MGQLERHRLHERTLRTEALKEEDELELEEDGGVNAGPATLSVAVLDPVADEAQVQLRLKVAVEVTSRDQLLKGDDNRAVQAAQFRWGEQGQTSETEQDLPAVC